MKTVIRSNYQQLLQLTDNDKNQGYWEQNTSIANNIKPLFASLLFDLEDAVNQSFEKFKAPFPGMTTKIENGYRYMKREPIDGDIKQQTQAYLNILRPMYPNLNHYYHNILESFYFPFFEEIDHMLQQEITFNNAQKMLNYIFNMYPKSFAYQLDILLPHHQLHNDLENIYEQATGDKDTTVIYDILIGVWNKSLEMDNELSKLSEQVKENDGLKQIFQTVAPEEILSELNNIQAGKKFKNDFQHFLEEFGYKTMSSRVLTDQTWFENPSIPLTTISSYVNSNIDVEQRFQKAVESRETKYSEVLNSIPEGEKKEEFKQYYEWALNVSNIDDDHHFYMDEMPTAKVRLCLLHLGDFLVTENIIEDNQDIFYLYLDELETVLKKPESLTKLIFERKVEYQNNLSQEAPSSYGTPPSHSENKMDIISERSSGNTLNNEISTSEYIKGLAGSKGTYTGAVKIINNEEEFNKLEDGDVLVTHMTTPAWSVLFLRSGAIVTNVGGLLSHPGINAREYQIPAVLGTKNATTELKDGDIVTVDGTNGCVTLDEQA